MLSDGVREVFYGLVLGLNVDAQTILDGGGGGYWADACDHDAG